MTKTFKYSILQYKHSISLGESLNVGILYYFEDAPQNFYFVYGSGHRPNAIYIDFDQVTFNHILKGIEKRIAQSTALLIPELNSKARLKSLISDFFLAEDSTVFQFTDPVNAINVYSDRDTAINNYSKLLLPGLIVEKHTSARHNEQFISRQFIGYLQEFNPAIEKIISRDHSVRLDDNIEISFDFAWKKDNLNLVKLISFDLSDSKEIQEKAAKHSGYLQWLSEKSNRENINFDLLIAEPQNRDLYKTFERAWFLLDQINVSKQIYSSPKDWKRYSQSTVEILSN